MDIKQVQKRLTQLQQSSTTASSFWKPQPGTTQIRIVPYKFNKDNPFIELYFYYSLGDNRTHLSPVSHGRPDPVNEFADKLKSSGDRDEWIHGKKLEPKLRTFVPVVVRGEEHNGVRFWGFGKTVYQELLEFIADPDYGDITDPVSGRDIVVTNQTPAEAGNKYGKTTVRVKPNPVALTEDTEMLEGLFASQVDIKELHTEPTYEELQKILAKYLNPDDEVDESSDNESEDSSATDSPATSTEAATNPAELNKKFDELFSESTS